MFFFQWKYNQKQLSGGVLEKGCFYKLPNILRNVCAGVIFIKKETLAQVFPCEIWEIFKNIYFYKTPALAESS